MVLRGSRILIGVAAVLLLLGLPGVGRTASAAEANAYTVTALVSNYGAGTTVDPHLVNAWGLVAGPTTPWWVNAADADKSLLYNAAGAKQALEVTVAGGPTGIVFNGDSTAFPVGATNVAARFIFATESGTIAGWAGALGTTAQVKADSSETGASYKGLAIVTTSRGPVLYAANFANARVDAFDRTWSPVWPIGGFVDPTLPAGYAPFGIQTIGSRVFVAFAKMGEPEDGAVEERAGQGLGIVDAFDVDGNFLVRIAQHGQLNAPWGLAMAPADFGRFSGDLLVGNFGDGQINAYEEMPNGHFEYRGVLRTNGGQPVMIDGLWALEFGNGAANNGPTNTLFFTAGPNGEEDGLFGAITVG